MSRVAPSSSGRLWIPLVLAAALPWSCGDERGENPRLVAVTSGSGGSAAFLSSPANAGTWTGGTTLTVAEGAELLVVGLTDDGGDALPARGVEVVLRAPSGDRRVTLAAGAITAVGFAEVDLALPVADPALTTWIDEELFAGLDEEAVEADFDLALARLHGADPDHPVAAVPESVSTGIDAGEEELRALHDAVPTGLTAGAGQASIVVFGPSPGTWTIDVSVQSGASATELLAWTLPAQGDGAAIDELARALADASALGQVTAALGPGEGDDPGGTWHLEQFRHPPAWSADWYRAKAYNTVYTIVQWLVLRGIFTKAIDILLKLDGTTALLLAGVTKDQLKVASIFCVAMIYRQILKNAALADLWFWRIAYSFNCPDNYFRVFYLGNVTRESVFERYTFAPDPVVLGLNGFVERELLGGNMAKDPLKRAMWGFGSVSEAPKVAKWTVSPSSLALVKPHGQQDGDCTIESVMGQTEPGRGTLTVVVATQPAKLELPVTVAAELKLTVSPAKIQPGAKATLTVTGAEGLDDPVVYAWTTAGLLGTLSDGAGHSGRSFESSAKAVTYQADSDAPDQSSEQVAVTAWLAPADRPRVELGEAEVSVKIGVVAPRCEVGLGVWEAPAEWQAGDPNPQDVTCELSSGTWVIDPDSLTGCYSSSSCVAQCKGWSTPVPREYIISWQTYDAEGNLTGGNHCSGGDGGDCDTTLTWMKSACAENFCIHPGMPGGGFDCAPCGCACGGGNCYPWTGPGKIVFGAFTNAPCTDGAECYYYGRPGHTHGSIAFALVHCGSVDNALPNCPGNVP